MIPTAFIIGNCVSATGAEPIRKPNVVLVITDDQGYGDLGCHGNPDLKTPVLDAFAKQSAHLRQFHVCPVCAPTRSSLLTGRYNYRTGVTDTYLGRALMRPAEVTLAERLREAGYRTGIFGKWHLGDNYPLRPGDQGFQESLVLKGGGIGQPSDPPGGESYFDPLLLRNGKIEQTKGYCSDVFTDAALEFIARRAPEPFFAYLAFNAPHGPLEVPDAALAPYQGRPLSPGTAEIAGKFDVPTTAKIYGMVSNIDANLGRLFQQLDELNLSDNTIVIFLTDNGPQQPRYNAGMRGLKGTVYEGGIRVPCYVRWPQHIPAGRVIDTPTAHIDVVPTLLDLCGLKTNDKFDGTSLKLLLTGANGTSKGSALDRTLFFQWHRGDEPQEFRAFAARNGRWKLVQAEGVAPGLFMENPPLELFDLEADPGERTNLAEVNPQIVRKLKDEYTAWFRDVTAAGFAPPRIQLGTVHENPTLLTRQDWRGPKAGWAPTDVGHWEVELPESCELTVTVHFSKSSPGTLNLELAGQTLTADVRAEQTEFTFPAMRYPAGPTRLQATLPKGVRFVSVERR